MTFFDWMIVAWFGLALFFGAIVELVGRHLRNNHWHAGLLGMLLGPLGVLFIPLIPDLRERCGSCGRPISGLRMRCRCGHYAPVTQTPVAVNSLNAITDTTLRSLQTEIK